MDFPFHKPFLPECSIVYCCHFLKAVTLQFSFRPLQDRHASIEIEKKFLDLGDDAALLVDSGQQNAGLTDEPIADV
jgi:hypothetical protein